MNPAADRPRGLAWGTLAAGLLVAQQVTGRATRDALFLSHHPATALPLVTIAASVVAVAAALSISRVLARRPPQQVVPALIGLNAALLLVDFLLAQAAPALAAILVYLQLAASGGTLLSGYWSVVNERFDPWTARRVVGRLALGASLGGVAGGIAALAAARALSIPMMLLLTAALGIGALVALVQFGGDPGPPPARAHATPPASLRSLRSVPYLQLIALLVALGAMAETLLDYVVKARAAAALPPGAPLLAFFAAFHAAISMLALLGQALARPALQRLGLAGSIALRPLAVAASAALGVLDPRLWSAALARGSHDVLTNSIFRSGYELLYTPLPAAEKRAAKQVVDVAFDKLGALAGGVATLAAVRLLAVPERPLIVLAGLLSLLALALTGSLHRGYVGTLARGLRAGRVRLDPEDVVDSTTRFTLAHVASAPATPPAAATLHDAPADGQPPPDPLLRQIAALRSGDAERVRNAVADPRALDVGLVSHLVPLVGRNDVYRDALSALRALAPRATGQLIDHLLDPGTDPVVRRRLPRVLKSAPGPRAVEGLLRGLDDPLLEVRAACGVALGSVIVRSPGLTAPPEAVFAAVRRELSRPGALAGSRAPLDDAVLLHVFGLLSLVLEREPLQIAARALRGSDAGLKGTALEYLDNVLPPDVRALLLAHFEPIGRRSARPREELLTDLMRSSGPLAGPRARR